MTAQKTKKGFTMIELVVYVGILALIVVALGSTLISTTRSYRAIKASRIMHESALGVFNRLSYEIRSSYRVDVGQSSFGNDDGALFLEKSDGVTNSNIYFDLVSGRVAISENGQREGYLTSDDIEIERLRFDVFEDDGATIISVETRLRIAIGDYTYEKDFQSSYSLRGAY